MDEQGLMAVRSDQHTLGPGKCKELGGFEELGFVGSRRGSDSGVRWRGAWLSSRQGWCLLFTRR